MYSMQTYKHRKPSKEAVDEWEENLDKITQPYLNNVFSKHVTRYKTT